MAHLVPKSLKMEGESGDFDSSTVDGDMIKKILCEMKSEFNKDTAVKEEEDVKDSDPEPSDKEETPLDQKEVASKQSIIKQDPPDPPEAPRSTKKLKTGVEEPVDHPEEDKPRIVLTLRNLDKDSRNHVPSKRSKLNHEDSEKVSKPGRRRGRLPKKAAQEQAEQTKRFSRREAVSRRSSRESILQSAIALKEKSLSSFDTSEEKPHRRSLRSSEPESRTSGRSPKRCVKSETASEESSPEKQDGQADNADLRSVLNGKDGSAGASSSSSLDASSSCSRKEVTPLNIEEDCSSSSEVSCNMDLLCECRNMGHKLCCKSEDGSTKYCDAYDQYDYRIVGCTNVVEVDKTPLMTPSKRVPFLLLCQVHLQRILRHQTCATCGIFCTLGEFTACKNKHLFHKTCSLSKEKSVCPHCSSEQCQDIVIKMAAHKYPILMNNQSVPNDNKKRARISVGSGGGGNLLSLAKPLHDTCLPDTSIQLPNGSHITAEGMEGPDLESLKSAISSISLNLETNAKFTYRNLYHASKHGDVEKVLQILAAGRNPNLTVREGTHNNAAIHAAASRGHLLVLHILVQAGADIEALDKELSTPLMLAVYYKHNHVSKYLIRAGANPAAKDINGMTPLHLAAKEGNLEVCHIMLTAGRLVSNVVDSVDEGRWTPLVWAAENCHHHVVRYLLERGADPHIRDSEMNIALHWAALSGSMHICEDLLDYGSNINSTNTYGDTPLHIAARQNARDCVLLLLSRGAKADVLNHNGQMAKDCCVDTESPTFHLLEFHSAISRFVCSMTVGPKVLSQDISRGREPFPIQCINEIDDDPLPKDYVYVTENCFTTNLAIDRRITTLSSCKCEDECMGSDCHCTRISLRCWYDNKGKLVPEFNFSDPAMLFECNALCDCNVLRCKNRVVQNGSKARFRLVKTVGKGWGVITLKDIPKGSYVCEYIGEIISDSEADIRHDDSYLFDLDNKDGETYCVDARKYGNIARFINHSCKPSLMPVRVYIGHHDLHFPRLALFANKDISAYEELSYDYGIKFWMIKYKSFTCQCSLPECLYSDKTIHDTIQKYQEKVQLEDCETKSAFRRKLARLHFSSRI